MMLDFKNIAIVITAFISFFLLLIIYSKGRNIKINRIYSLNIIFIISWLISMMIYRLASPETNLFWVTILYISPTLIASSFLYFTYIFPTQIKKINLLSKILIFLPNLILIGLILVPDLIIKEVIVRPNQEKLIVWGPAYFLYVLYTFSIFSYAFFRLFRKYTLSKNVVEKMQIIYLAIGYTIAGNLAMVTNLFMPWFGRFELNWLGQVFTLFMVIFATYAIFKHHLLNIKVIATEFLVGLVAIVLVIDLFLSESLLGILIKTEILLIFLYLGVSLIRSVLKEIEYREKIKKAYVMEKKARAEIEKITEAKTQFIMATQHHLRTPLTSMIGYLDLIFGGTYGKVSAKLKMPLTKFQVSSRRLIRVVSALLDISQFQMGKQVVTLQPGIKFDDLIKEVIEELEFEVKIKGLYIKYDKKGEVPTIKADPEKLKVALFNIIDNAIKYTKKGGITLTLQKAGTNARLSVKDTGIGLEPEKAKVLFKSAFVRGKEAKKVHGFGRGIGVYVTGHIINAHNGKIWAESEGKGKGTTFFIELK